MRSLRTPGDRFAVLPDFPYEPRYADVPDGDGGSLRISWVEAGPPQGPVVLLLHGEPSWSFLYRKVMRLLAGAGLHAIAPDLPGFGRSDKPAEVADHTYARHVEWMRSLAFDVLSLRGVTLVGHDWGGLIGLRLAAEHPDRFERIVAANTGLPTGDQEMPQVWWAFRQAMTSAPTIDIGRFIQAGCKRPLAEDVRAAYEAPFPDPGFQAAPRAMPALVPTSPGDPAAPANRAAWERLRAWDKPFLVAFSDSDPITAQMAPIFKRAIPGAAGRDHPVIADAGHFLQEDAGEQLGEAVATFIRATS